MTATQTPAPDDGSEAATLAGAADRLDATLRRTLVTRREFRIALVVVALLFLGFGRSLWLLSDVVDEQGRTTEELTDVTETNRELIDTLAECTTPTPPHTDDPHECYEDAQLRQADLLTEVFDRFGEALDRLGDRVLAGIEDAAASG